MALLARFPVPDGPHHVTQRGNGRARVFFSDEDYRFYVGLLRAVSVLADVRVWCWCLIPNHVHLMLETSGETAGPVLRRCPSTKRLMSSVEAEAMAARHARALSVGRPVVSADFMAMVEERTGRNPNPANRGPGR